MHATRSARQVILHYHLFKNAGTSVDEVLKANFGDAWVTREFERRGNPNVHRREVAEWVRSHPKALAFSSHTLELPPPAFERIQVLPVIFVRHPIDRICSAYAFERRQGGDGFGAVLARHTSLAGYIEVRLSMPRDRQCRDFHLSRFATMFPEDSGSEAERAARAVEALPFVGVVEQFDTSMARLQALIAAQHPSFQLHSAFANASHERHETLDQRLARLRAEMGEHCWSLLMQHNAGDLALHALASQRLANGG